MELVGDAVQLLARVADAREVGHDGEANLGAQQPADLRGALARAATGAVSDGDEVRCDLLQRGRGLPQGLNAGIILGREKLQRAQRALLREEFGDGPVGGHSAINASESDDTCKAPIASYFAGSAGT